MSTADSTTLRPKGRELAKIALVTLGVVYGDIGTSPLYALRECFHGSEAVGVSHDNVLGALSLIFWSLMIVISVKYMVFVLRADNDGEGGILALMALLGPDATAATSRRRSAFYVMIGLFGAALLYGDGMITPAISVLSAIEGLEVATSTFTPYVEIITIVVLIGLFSLQKHGTAKIGAFFGPIMVIWFATLAVLGIVAIAHHPSVLAAVSPHYAVMFFLHNGLQGYLVMGAVFLVVTGGEALYADMGHLGPYPIRLDWVCFVLPSLLLNYFGQGAYLIAHPEAHVNTFYALVPGWGLYPMVVLATAATVIASQAVISGVFSLTMQAVQLGYLPRMQIDHTSAHHYGQIYIAPMNWLLMVATIGLVLGFKRSTDLAAAYGVAVTITMIITTVLFHALARNSWKWPLVPTWMLTCLFLTVDISFFGANIVKVLDGGWFPLLVAGLLFTIATTWKRGRAIAGRRIRENLTPLNAFLDNIKKYPPTRVRGTAVFLTGNPDLVPLAMIHNLKHNQVLHDKVILLTVNTAEQAYVRRKKRLEMEDLGNSIFKVAGTYGFMEDPDVPKLLEMCAEQGVKIEPMQVTYFLGRESYLATKRPGMAIWRERLFAILARNAMPANAFFHIPPNRVIEVGTQIEL
ncbi:MAG: potassium transporter Kup [Planctomycetes bacterium]|nr:potassium transporter Kup [Planctomycetota bacterium]